MSSAGFRHKWSQVRILVLATLLAPAAYLAGENFGYRDGIRARIGGSGQFTTAVVEWQDTSKRQVVAYLNDGANGYSFWLTLNPGFLHYTAAAKVFTCDNMNRESIHECMDKSRAWARDDWEGAVTRIVGGELKPRADAIEADGFQVVEDQQEAVQLSIMVGQRQELEILRADVNRMALKIATLEREREK